MSDIIFGPLNSRRFGLSLGVDLSPKEKNCNYDCIYCELAAAKPLLQSKSYPSVENIIAAIKANKQDYDILTITANGEPSLYPDLKGLIACIKSLNLGKKILILSNGTAVLNNYESLLDFDIVKLSLDSVVEKSFKKINKAHKDIKLLELIPKIASFSRDFKGELVLETLLIKDINDSDEDILALNEALKDIKAIRLDLSTLDRPPAYPCKALSDKELAFKASLIDKIPVFIARRKPRDISFDFSKEELLKLLHLRPASLQDISCYTPQTKKYLNELIAQKKVKISSLAGIDFYKA